ncbi:dioxygenase [Metarhizium brunneum]
MAQPTLPGPLLDLTTDNITPNVVRISTQSGNARVNYLMERLITHLHDFARETRLSTTEWMAALDFLVRCGQMSSDLRHEFILLSDVLALSLLVDSINHPKPPASTEGSNLAPPCACTVSDTAGNPVSDVKVDIWETDSSGQYDVQHDHREGPRERCIIVSDAKGKFWFKAVRPVSYAIPEDGPVGQLLKLLKRHCWRPAHMHFMFEKDGWDHLTTALYMRGDPYETSDAVFAVKRSLIVDLEKVDAATAAKYGVKEGTLLLKHDFVLVTQKEADELRDRNAIQALRELGLSMKLVDHLPVPDLD